MRFLAVGHSDLGSVPRVHAITCLLQRSVLRTLNVKGDMYTGRAVYLKSARSPLTAHCSYVAGGKDIVVSRMQRRAMDMIKA